MNVVKIRVEKFREAKVLVSHVYAIVNTRNEILVTMLFVKLLFASCKIIVDPRVAARRHRSVDWPHRVKMSLTFPPRDDYLDSSA